MSMKDKGNQFFRKNKFEEAIDCYTKYLQEDSSADKKVAYTNISFCHFKLNQYMESIEAADNAIQQDQTYAKAYYRKMHAYKEIKGHEYDVYINGQLLIAYSPQMDQKNKYDTQDIIKTSKQNWISELNHPLQPQTHPLFDIIDHTPINTVSNQPNTQLFFNEMPTLNEWLQRWSKQGSMQSKWEEIENVIVKNQEYGLNLAFLYLNQLQQPDYDALYKRIKDIQNTLSTKMDIENAEQDEKMSNEDEQQEEPNLNEVSSSSDENLFDSSSSPAPHKVQVTHKAQHTLLNTQSLQPKLLVENIQVSISSVNNPPNIAETYLKSENLVIQQQQQKVSIYQPCNQQVVGHQSLYSNQQSHPSAEQVELLYEKWTVKLNRSGDVYIDLLSIVQGILQCNQPVIIKRRLLDLIKQKRQREINLLKKGVSKKEQAKVKDLLVSNGMQSYLVDFANKHVLLK